MPNAAHHDQLVRLKDDPDYIRLLLRQRGSKLKERERQRIESLLALRKRSGMDAPRSHSLEANLLRNFVISIITALSFE